MGWELLLAGPSAAEMAKATEWRMAVLLDSVWVCYLAMKTARGSGLGWAAALESASEAEKAEAMAPGRVLDSALNLEVE